jgi:hypothetical protein
MKIRIPIFTREPISSHITFLSKDKYPPGENGQEGLGIEGAVTPASPR